MLVLAASPVLATEEPSHAVDASPSPTRRAVPILMHHVIAEPPPSARFPDLYVPPTELRAQVRWLADAGYEAVTLGRVFDAWQGRATLPSRPVVLTFDDGYRSHVTAALPILATERWPGVLNLDLSNLAPSWGLSVARVRRMLAAGWSVDAHSLTHADLAALSPSSLAREVRGSRREIERLFGVRPRFFCYPAGRYDADAIDAVEAAGYEGATTTRHGLAVPEERFTLARIRVSRGDGAAGLARKLAALGLPVSRGSGPARRHSETSPSPEGVPRRAR